MTDGCFRLDEFESLLDLAPDDPRQRHLAACPLCRARLAEYRAFITEGPPAVGSRPEEANAALEAFTVRMIRGAGGAGGGGFWSRFRALRAPRIVLVPGLAAAAIAAVILIAILHPFPGGDERRPSLRGSSDSTITELAVKPVLVRDGAVTFTWSLLPDADRYEVQIFDANLDQIARFDAGATAGLKTEPGVIPGADGVLWWRVVAFRDGDELGRSPLSALSRDGR
jgi:hypothetical protein